jgi:alkylhydroperoxidase family enzyme
MSVSSTTTADTAKQRVRPLPANEWSPEVRELLGATHESVAALTGEAVETEPKTLNILKTIAHHPKLLGPFLGFAAALAQEGALSRRDSELLALRVIWHSKSDFEWGHHVAFARTAGMTDEEIARIVVGPEAPEWNASDRALLRAADQLYARQQIDDAVWSQLASERSEAQLVEIPFVVGQYMMLSMVANATGVELEEEYDPLPESPVSADR